MAKIRRAGKDGKLGAIMTAVVVDGKEGKEYRLPTDGERAAADTTEQQLQELYKDIPFGLPEELLPAKEALGIRVPLYGLTHWRDLFTPRQLFALGTFVKHTRAARNALATAGYPPEWVEAVGRNAGLRL